MRHAWQSHRRLYLGIIFPQDAKVPPIHMFFSKSAEGMKVLEAACKAAGVKLDRGRMARPGDDAPSYLLMS